MFDFINRLNNNPVYIKDTILLERRLLKEEKTKNFFSIIPSGLKAAGTEFILCLLIPIFFIFLPLIMIFTEGGKLSDLASTLWGALITQILILSGSAGKASSLIIGEKEQRTYDSLKGTPLNSGEILAGKFWAVFRPLLYILTINFAIYLITGITAGINVMSLPGVYILTAAYIAFFTIMSLWLSSRIKNSKKAEKTNAWIIFLIFFGTMMIWILLYPSSGFLKFLSGASLSLNPAGQIAILFGLLNETGGFEPPEKYLFVITGTVFIIYTITAIFLWKNTLKYLEKIDDGDYNRKTFKKHIAPPLLPVKSEALSIGKLKNTLPILNFISRMINNPVYIIDRTVEKNLDRYKKLVMPCWSGYLAIVLIPVILEVINILRHEDFYHSGTFRVYFFLSCFFQIIYFCCKTILNASPLFIREKEQKILESIITTTLTPQEILRGKFLTVFYPLAYELTVLFPLFLFTGHIAGVHFFKLLILYLLTLGQIAFLITIKLAGATQKLVKNKEKRSQFYPLNIFNTEFGKKIAGPFVNTFESGKKYSLLKYAIHLLPVLAIIVFILVPVGIIFAFAMAAAIINPFFYTAIILFSDFTFKPSGINIYYFLLFLFISLSPYTVFPVLFWQNSVKNLSQVPEE